MLSQGVAIWVWMIDPSQTKKGPIKANHRFREPLSLYKEHRDTSPYTETLLQVSWVKTWCQRMLMVCYSAFSKSVEHLFLDMQGIRSLLQMWQDLHRLEWKKMVPIGTLQKEETMGSLPPGDIATAQSCGLSRRESSTYRKAPYAKPRFWESICSKKTILIAYMYPHMVHRYRHLERV